MKHLIYLLAAFIVLFCSSLSLAQLDSVWYEGPSVGIVDSGAVQSTDNFSDSYIIPPGDIKSTPLNVFWGSEPIEMVFNWDESQLSEYVYVEDSNLQDKITGNGGQTVLLNSFPGIPMTGWIPPDPTIAVGPNHIMGCANNAFRIWDKEGNVLKTISAASWFLPVSPFAAGDPQVIYDHYEGRWFLLYMELNSPAQISGNLIAYSDDDNPLGEWYIYRLDTKMHGTIPSNTWGDYPKVGFDEEAIYIMTNCLFSGYHQYDKFRIISKAELYSSNSGPLTYTDIWNIRTPGQGPGGQVLYCIHPAISYTQGSGQYFLWAAGVGNIIAADYYALYQITNPLTTPSLRGKVLPAQYYYKPPNANQLGGGTPIEALGFVTRAPIVRDGFLYVTHGIRNSTNTSYSSIKYIKVDLSTNTVVEEVEFGAEGFYYLDPALVIDKDHNIAITYSKSADTEYCGAFYSTRHANDPPGLSPSQVLAEGLGNYDYTVGSRNRWGDYMGIYLDPDTDYDIWMFTEYAIATQIWGTYVGQIRMVPFQGVYAFVKPLTLNFGDVEFMTISDTLSTIITNYGDQDLVITDMPSSVGDFTLETSVSLPKTLSSYDSLELKFTFSPTLAGLASELFPITNNDPNFLGITLIGNGYIMYPALDKTIYASSGIQNNGNILTIDETTGAGTILGLSLFDEVTSISIGPDSVIYGLVSNNTDADIVRVNTGGGDSYLLFHLDIPQMAGIAFDTIGTLYGISIFGEIFTIDLTNGSDSLVVDAEGSYKGFTFNPVTNELWASSRSNVPPNKDAIFTVDLTNGDTTIIGHTGLDKKTNDIVFDENLNLYGVIGASGEINEFINIDTSTAAGTIVGSIGFKHILGLAYEETGVTSVEDDKDETIPTDFALKQNYPNPFNPTTQIKFTISELRFTTLKVYDILGREVATLVNEEKPIGNYEIEFSATGGAIVLSSGIYLYQLRAGDFVQTKKMILLK